MDGAGAKVITGDEAVAIVREYIQAHGGDPDREECSASKIDTQAIKAEMKNSVGKEYSTLQMDERWKDECWLVTAWHVWYPNNEGKHRLVPGGFTDYTLSGDGRILRISPGR